MTVKTYRVERRQPLGGGRFREHGELIPEAHLWFGVSHFLHTGEIKDVTVDEDTFLEAIERFVDQVDEDMGDRILEAVGLGSAFGSPEDSGIADVPGQARSAPLLPQSLPETSRVTSTVVATSRRRRHRHGETGKPAETTIMATDAPPGAPSTPGPVPHHRKGKSMVQQMPREGDKGVYEDQSTVDPSDLNEAQTSTRPEDLEQQDATIAYQGPAATGGEDPGAGIAPNPVAEPVGADLTTGSVASTTPGAPPVTGTGDPADIEGSASSGDATATGAPADEASASSATPYSSGAAVGEGDAAVPAGDGATVIDTPTDQATVTPVDADVNAPTYYRHEGTGDVDAAVWPDSGLKNADGDELYTFVEDSAPGDAKGASSEWVVDHPAS